MEKVCVEGVRVERGHVTGVQTDQGYINCEIFVNCGGQVRADSVTVTVCTFVITITVCSCLCLHTVGKRHREGLLS